MRTIFVLVAGLVFGLIGATPAWSQGIEVQGPTAGLNGGGGGAGLPASTALGNILQGDGASGWVQDKDLDATVTIGGASVATVTGTFGASKIMVRHNGTGLVASELKPGVNATPLEVLGTAAGALSYTVDPAAGNEDMYVAMTIGNGSGTGTGTEALTTFVPLGNCTLYATTADRHAFCVSGAVGGQPPPLYFHMDLAGVNTAQNLPIAVFIESADCPGLDVDTRVLCWDTGDSQWWANGSGTWRPVSVKVPATNQTYNATNVTTDRTYDANSTTLDEVADVLGTLIGDLRTKGLVD